jgi:hypothetical protein
MSRASVFFPVGFFICPWFDFSDTQSFLTAFIFNYTLTVQQAKQHKAWACYLLLYIIIGVAETSCRCSQLLLISCQEVQEVVGSNPGRDMSVSGALVEDGENPGQVPP